MQKSTPLFPSIGALLGYTSSFILNNGELSEEGLGISRVLFLTPFLLFQSTGGSGEEGTGLGMDFSKVGERILSSVRSARSLGLLPSSADQSGIPEIPARAAAAAAVARAIAGLPPHQQFSLPSGSEKLRSIYESRSQEDVIDEPEENFYEEGFDPIRHILELVPVEGDGLEFLEKQAALRLVQLDVISERLSRQVMEHREVMVKGMNLVRELENELNVASSICMNGRMHLTSSMNEVSRDLIVNSHSKKKQALLDIFSVLVELRHALNMQGVLESLAEDGNYCKAFQVLSEYLQLLDSLSELSSVQEMSRGVETWLGTTLQRLDSLLLGVCQEFKDEHYLTVVDAYALIGDVTGLAEKLQSFFMQEVLSDTHSILKSIVHGGSSAEFLNSRLTYSDLCFQIPESKFQQCLSRTLANLFRLMCSYYKVMSFELEQMETTYGNTAAKQAEAVQLSEPAKVLPTKTVLADSVLLSNNESKEIGHSITPFVVNDSSTSTLVPTRVKVPSNCTLSTEALEMDSHHNEKESGSDLSKSSCESPWYHLRKDATMFISQILEHGKRNFWQLATSRVAVLLSVTEANSASVPQFLKNFEDLNTFILAGEAFCGFEAVEFRKKMKTICENYFASLHRQYVHALRMVLEKETWAILSLDSMQIVNFAGLVGDGAPLIASSRLSSAVTGFHLEKSINTTKPVAKKTGFMSWLKAGNPFLPKLIHHSNEGYSETHNGVTSVEYDGDSPSSRSSDKSSPKFNGHLASEDENEDLLADFIDEDSQLPSRIAKPNAFGTSWKGPETSYLTGSSLCLLRSMDKYARLMQKLELLNVELFKGILQLFEVFFYFLYDIFVQSNGKGFSESINHKLKATLSRISQDCDQFIKPQIAPLSSSNPLPFSPYMQSDVTPTSPTLVTSSGLKERCSGANTLTYVAQILKSSKSHLQSLLLLRNPALVEDFYTILVDCVPDLVSLIHRTTARLMLQVQGFADKIANAKWEVKELGLEHNSYVDLLLGEFKFYTTKIVNGGIDEEMQRLLLEYGVEIVAEVFVEGLSRVKRCTDEGRALMSLDMQVLINGLKHFVSVDVKPKFLIVETFIKAYYLPETEYFHWPRAHPEYTKSQITGLINLVATMKGWKRKTRLEILEKLE